MDAIRVLLSAGASTTYDYLSSKAPTSKIHRSILNSIDRKIGIIKEDRYYGAAIRKSLIPEEYKIEYGSTNLFRVELSDFWRMLYTLTNDEAGMKTVAIVLDIINHETYDKKFGYKHL